MTRTRNEVTLRSPMKGVDGRGILAASRAPLSADGRIGDFWIDKVAKRLYGPKSAAGWPDNGLIKGDGGWTPVLAVVDDGERRVQQVVDWTGGEGTKPAVNQYVGETGLVADIDDAIDVRGAAGANLPPDEQHRGGWSAVVLYQPRNTVTFGGVVWMATVESVNEQPGAESAFWVSLGPPFTGGTLTGKLVISPSTVTRAGINIPLGSGPTTAVTGDIVHFTDGMVLYSTNGIFSFAFTNKAQTWATEQTFAPAETFGYSLAAPLQNGTPTGGALKIGGIRHDANGLYIRRTVNGSDVDDKFRTADPSTLPAGATIRTDGADQTSWISASTVIPLDDTLPTSSEGDSIVSKSYTPALTSSLIDCEATIPIFVQAGGSAQAIVAIFRGSTCVGASVVSLTDGEVTNASVKYRDSPASTSALSYSVRLGPTAAGFLFVNGNNSGRLLGGASRARLSLTEVRG